MRANTKWTNRFLGIIILMCCIKSGVLAFICNDYSTQFPSNLMPKGISIEIIENFWINFLAEPATHVHNETTFLQKVHFTLHCIPTTVWFTLRIFIKMFTTFKCNFFGNSISTPTNKLYVINQHFPGIFFFGGNRIF